MRYLRQSTASQEILLGPFVAAADGTAQTGLTIANTDIKLLLGGTTSEASKNSGGGAHIAGGRYSAVLDATDTANVGILEVSVAPASGIPWNKSYFVLEARRYDSLFGAGVNNPLFGVITSGTLQSATSSTAVLASATSLADDLVNNSQLEITGGTGAGQQRAVTDWVSSTDTATVSPDWTTTPDNTSTYELRAMSPAPTATGSLPSVNLVSIAGATTDVSALATNVAAILVDTGTTLDAFIQAIKAKTDNLPSDPADASVVAGLIAAAEAKIDIVDTVVDAIKLKTDNLPSDPADASVVAGLIAGVDAKVDIVDTVVDAVKVKTDQMVFTTANMLDVAVKRVASTTLTPAGTGGQGIGG